MPPVQLHVLYVWVQQNYFFMILTIFMRKIDTNVELNTKTFLMGPKQTNCTPQTTKFNHEKIFFYYLNF